MSFWPFPKIILDELRAGLSVGAGFEVGAGDGRLRNNLSRVGIALFTLDRRGAVDLRADARALPFADGLVGVLVAGNLLRHLDPVGRQRFLDEAARVLGPDGRLLLLEDDPRPRSAPERHYRLALELLAAADPSRGAALDLSPLFDAVDPARWRVTVDLRLENAEQVVDPEAPLRWLASRDGCDTGRLGALASAVAREGMRYGRFRAGVLRRCGAVGGAH